MVIPAGITVTVTSNESYTGSAMRIRIYGTLYFDGGGAKLSMPCGSIVELMTPSSRLSGNSSGNSQTIKICNSTVWSVGTDNNAAGYQAYPANSTLPVTLLYFKAEPANGAVLCQWATASEQHSAYFVVESSSDGERYSAVGTIAAGGNSQQALQYAFTDEAPCKGLSYYRLVQVDTDGSTVRYDAVAVHYEPAHGGIYPNPSSGPLFVASATNDPITIDVLDASGQMVIRQGRLDPRAGFDASSLPAGVYTVVATVAGGQHRSGQWVKMDR